MKAGTLLAIGATPACTVCGTTAWGVRVKGQCARCYHRTYQRRYTHAVRAAGRLCADCAAPLASPVAEYCAGCALKHRHA
jgi:hypothetical protein